MPEPGTLAAPPPLGCERGIMPVGVLGARLSRTTSRMKFLGSAATIARSADGGIDMPAVGSYLLSLVEFQIG